MVAAKFFKVTWYITNDNAKHVIVYDKYEDMFMFVRGIMDDNHTTSYYVTAHSTMPKE